MQKKIIVITIILLLSGWTYSFSLEQPSKLDSYPLQEASSSMSPEASSWFSGVFKPFVRKIPSSRANEPAVIFLFGAGLVGLSIFTRKKFSK